jgi:hypothetical protein
MEPARRVVDGLSRSWTEVISLGLLTTMAIVYSAINFLLFRDESPSEQLEGVYVELRGTRREIELLIDKVVPKLLHDFPTSMTTTLLQSPSDAMYIAS